MAKQTGGNATMTPLKKPVTTVSTTIPAALVTPSIQKTVMLKISAIGTNVLNTPIRSDTALGAILPKTDAALKMATM